MKKVIKYSWMTITYSKWKIKQIIDRLYSILNLEDLLPQDQTLHNSVKEVVQR
jgi:hypothetical protein